MGEFFFLLSFSLLQPSAFFFFFWFRWASVGSLQFDQMSRGGLEGA